MLILDGTDGSLDDLINCSKLHSLLLVIIDKVNEQGAAIKQLRERDASLAKFRKQVVAAFQMCVEKGSEKVKLEERLSVLEDVTACLPRAEAELANAEARAQGLARELSSAELQVEQSVASLEKKMDEEVERKLASLEWKMETQTAWWEEKLEAQEAQAEQNAANAELMAQGLRRVEAHFESTEQRLQEVQAQADLYVKECSADHRAEMVIAVPKAAKASMEPTIPVGLLFPDQDSTYVTMMRSAQDFPAVQEMLKKAKVILGWDVLELCLKGPESKLQETRFCQPVAFIAGLAAMEKLRQNGMEAAKRFQVTAGQGTGEYAALCAAGVFSFEDGLRLVDVRGKAIQEAASICNQAVLFVFGLEKPTLEKLCTQAQKSEGISAVCQIAGELCPNGFECAGTGVAVHTLMQMSEKAGAWHVDIRRGRCAMRTPLMAPANVKLGRALDEMLPKMKPPRHTVYMNITAEPIKPGTNPKAVVDMLKLQLTNPGKWESSVRAMIKSGVTDFYALGRGSIKRLIEFMDPKVGAATTNIEI